MQYLPISNARGGISNTGLSVLNVKDDSIVGLY